MFNWFNRKSHVEEIIEAVKDRGTVVTPLPPQDQTAYMVGKTEQGKTVLRIGASYSFSTLTMNDAGVHKLIKMLEAALEGEVSETEGHDGRGPG